MRPLDSLFEASFDSAVSSKHSGPVMDLSEGDGNKEGQQPQQQQQQKPQHKAYLPGSLPPQESRQQTTQPEQQHRLQQPPQPPPQPWAQQPPQQPPPPLFGQPQQIPPQQQAYARHPYPQQQDMMAAAPSVLERTSDYMSTAQQQQQQPPQYMQHLPYAAAAAAGGGYSASRPYAQPQLTYQQQLAMQQSMMAAGGAPQQPLLHHHPQHHPHPMDLPPPQQVPLQQPYLQPKVGRLPADRPLIKLSVSLIDTYKQINTVYYEEREARRAARAKEKTKKGSGTNNNGWDDENYDYLITAGELFYGRYRIKERIGKGSFGQVVRAEDTEEGRDVAIKIIKSKKPFLMQAKTEIELLTHLNDKDLDDEHNIVRLITHFMYRNHQCLVFEMLSLNLYELLKNTQFGGVSLNLIRKFAKQVLKSLSFLARTDVDIIHCDLKPENILLRHPKKSGIKVIDFGSSCRSDKRMYSYIQSRFYRSPEVMLGLPYSVSIDVWSLGCILAEMHTGEPLFSGSDQFDQMQKIVKVLGMMPEQMLEQSNDQHRLQFFEKTRSSSSGKDEWVIKQQNTGSSRGGSSSQQQQPQQPKQLCVPSRDPIASLTEVIRAETHRKKKYPPSETGNSARNYELFVDLINRMLSYDPRKRIKPEEALNHPFIVASDQQQSQPAFGERR